MEGKARGREASREINTSSQWDMERQREKRRRLHVTIKK
jgi:hypothetical protein